MIEIQLCDFCLSRLNKKATRINEKECFVCGGIFLDIEKYKEKIVNDLASYDFGSINLGIRIPYEIQEREDEIKSKLKLRPKISIKTQIAQELIRAIREKIDVSINKSNPDLQVIVDFTKNSVEFIRKPIFFYGRYTKPPGVDQRASMCKQCGGKGCLDCKWSGRENISVEEIISKELMRFTGGSEIRFTWFGREDRQSLVSEPGRIFIAKIKRPILSEVPKEFYVDTDYGRLKVTGNIYHRRPLPPKMVVRVRVFVEKINDDARILSSFFKNRLVWVSKKNRKKLQKLVYWMKTKNTQEASVIEYEGELGIPVRGLINGGTVSPSVSEILKRKLNCLKFDIVEVKEVGELSFA